MALNVQTSIADYLKSLGQPSDYGYRSTLYAKSGLNLGAYGGTAQQNTALLNFLRGGGGNVATTPPAAQPAVAATPTPAPSAPVAATPRLDFVTAGANRILEADKTRADAQVKARQALIDFYAGLKPATERYQEFRTAQNLPAQEELVNALTKNVMGQEDVLAGIEPSVNKRVGDFLVTEEDRGSILAREQKPVIENLNKLLRNKQYEEIGLAGKQALVKELLTYSLQDDALRAKPLEMGVDYTTEDRKIAGDLMKSLFGTQTEAYGADVTAAEKKTATVGEQAFELSKQEKQFAHEIALEKVKQAGKTNEKKQTETDKVWNSIVNSSTSEWDVWSKINDNQAALKAKGIDVDELWRKHAALKAAVGGGGQIKGSSTIPTSSGGYSAYL